MKVTNNKIGNAGTPADAAKAGKVDGARASKSQGLANSANSATAARPNNVNVSERAQMMQKAKDIASGPMTVDEAKVARLQKMIDEGSYKVDAKSIADKLVDDHLLIPE